MRYIILVISILCISYPAYAGEFDSNSFLHLGGSVVLGVAADVVFLATPTPKAFRPYAAFTLAMMPGVFKELTDSRISAGDLLMDAVGATIGVMGMEFIITHNGIRYSKSF